MKQDISKGIDPIPGGYDILTDQISFTIDGKRHIFDSRKLPFTLKEAIIGGIAVRCADKALVLRHANG